jgi:hypothetical protein
MQHGWISLIMFRECVESKMKDILSWNVNVMLSCNL